MKIEIKKHLLQEGIVDHINRNRGKYALGAGIGGLGAYSAMNGNLRSAINTGINSTSATAGVVNSDMTLPEGFYRDALGNIIDSTKAVYNDPTDINMPLEPSTSYDVGNTIGDFASKIQDFTGAR